MVVVPGLGPPGFRDAALQQWFLHLVQHQLGFKLLQRTLEA